MKKHPSVIWFGGNEYSMKEVTSAVDGFQGEQVETLDQFLRIFGSPIWNDTNYNLYTVMKYFNTPEQHEPDPVK